MEYESIHRETRAREFFIASSRDEEMVEYESSIRQYLGQDKRGKTTRTKNQCYIIAQ